MTVSDIHPGMKIRVKQRIERRAGDWETEVVGTILSATPKSTGSWYAHGKDHKYWLLRLELQKDDGEITSLTLDRNTEISVIDD